MPKHLKEAMFITTGLSQCPADTTVLLKIQLLSPYGTALGHVHTRIISTTQATTKTLI